MDWKRIPSGMQLRVLESRMDSQARSENIPSRSWLQTSYLFAAGALSLSNAKKACWIIMRLRVNDRMQIQKDRFRQISQPGCISYLYITPPWKETWQIPISAVRILLLKSSVYQDLSAVSFKCVILKHAVWAWIRDNSVHHVFPVTKTQGDRTSRKAVEQSED